MQLSKHKDDRYTFYRSKRSIRWTTSLITVLLIGLASIVSSPVYAASIATSTQPTYIDKKFGFSLQLPVGWVATPHTGIHNTNSADVIFTNIGLPGTSLEVGVMRSSTAAADFARQGTPTLHIGNYPAFQQDTPGGVQFPIPCLGRTMLVHNDIVTASWCAKDATAHKQAFTSILATYRDHSITSIHVNALAQSQTPVNPVQTCQQVFSSGSNNPPATYPNDEWGTESVNPNDSTWTGSFGEGVAVCDNYYSGGGYLWGDSPSNYSYLFQCVELANRFINEEWNLPGFNGDAFAYYDNYQGGTYYAGLARAPGYNATLIDDASQGNNSAPPVPGDLLIFQDVTDGAHWTSGEISGDPGHVVVVTSVVSGQVNVVQQNWHNGEVHSFSLQHLSNGYHIVDNSGVYHRITRGWIHFGANSSGTDATAFTFTSNGIYALSSGGIFQYSSQDASWTQIGTGTALYADPGEPDLYATSDTSGDFYQYAGAPNQWIQLDTGVTSLAIQGTNLFATVSNGDLYQYTGTPNQWTKIGYGVMDVYVRGTDLFAKAGVNSDLYQYSGTPNQWTNLGTPSGGTDATAFTFTSNGIYALSSGGIFQYSSQDASWTQIGTGTALYADPGEPDLYATSDTSGDFYQYAGAPNQWIQLDTGVTSLAIQGTNLFATVSNGDLYQYTGTPNQWTKIGYGVMDVYVRGTDLFAKAGVNSDLYQYSGTPNQWTNLGTP